MLFIDFLFAAVIAILLAGLLAGIAGWRHPRHPGAGPTLGFLFVVLLAVVWVGGVWSAPYGPVLLGGYVLPFVFMGLAVALVILAMAPHPTPTETVAMSNEAQAETEAATASAVGVFGLFFWLLLLGAFGALLFHYLS